mgnify:CR=1 FL=1
MRINITRVPGPATPAGIVFCPVPPGAVNVAIPGVHFQSRPLAWRRTSAGAEPRLVMAAIAGSAPLPDTLELIPAGAPRTDTPAGAMPAFEIVSIERKARGLILRDVGEVRLHGSAGWLGIRMGLESDAGVMWWECVTASRLLAGAVCESWRIGGYAGIHHEIDPTLPGDGNKPLPPYAMHVHAWLYCELHLLLFAGGIVQVAARHINNRFFDRGRDLKNITPLIGFTSSRPTPGDGKWHALSSDNLGLGGARLNLKDAMTLAGDGDPAAIRTRGDVVEYRPYPAAVVTGLCGKSGGTTADDRIFPRGLARTVRFIAGLGDAVPHIARYVLPAWYHAQCGNLWPGAVLPVDGPAATFRDEGAQWLRDNMLRNCFDDGSIGRHNRRLDDGSIAESGWEGETAHALMLAYHLGGDPAILEDALRNAYNIADIIADHADLTMRMHGQGPEAKSLPMQRILGLLAGYLETADPYMLETAQAVVDSAYWWDRTNWPRRSFGRDAAYIRGLLALSDITDGEHYLARAREVLRRCAERQRPDGAFTDQGGTVGIHGGVNDVIKPWMNSVMAEAFCDFLERAHDDAIEQALLKLARWFRAAALTDDGGNVYWAYKYRHGENEGEPRTPGSRFPDLAAEHKGDDPWHGRNPETSDAPRLSVFRPLLMASRLTGDLSYVELCLKNLGRRGGGYHGIDQSANKCVEQGSWFDSHLWLGTWTSRGLETNPLPLPEGRCLRGVVHTPGGKITVESVGQQTPGTTRH